MSYAPRRPSISAKRRAAIKGEHKICHFCLQPIRDGEEYDIDHVIARELGGSDDASNLRPIHRGDCHKKKTALDKKLIAKSNRIRKKHGVDPVTKKTKPKPIRSAGFQKGHRPLRSRNQFQSRRRPDE